jgi:hypothetical protein
MIVLSRDSLEGKPCRFGAARPVNAGQNTGLLNRRQWFEATSRDSYPGTRTWGMMGLWMPQNYELPTPATLHPKSLRSAPITGRYTAAWWATSKFTSMRRPSSLPRQATTMRFHEHGGNAARGNNGDVGPWLAPATSCYSGTTITRTPDGALIHGRVGMADMAVEALPSVIVG